MVKRWIERGSRRSRRRLLYLLAAVDACRMSAFSLNDSATRQTQHRNDTPLFALVRGDTQASTHRLSRTKGQQTQTAEDGSTVGEKMLAKSHQQGEVNEKGAKKGGDEKRLKKGASTAQPTETRRKGTLVTTAMNKSTNAAAIPMHRDRMHNTTVTEARPRCSPLVNAWQDETLPMLPRFPRRPRRLNHTSTRQRHTTARCGRPAPTLSTPPVPQS